MASKRVGDIYKITVDKDFYIGSTFDFNKRLIAHKSFSTVKNSKLYIAIRHNNYEFDMELLYEYECYTDEELRMEEQRCYEELKPNLNMKRPYISKEEKIEVNKQTCKEYYIENKESRLEYQNQYYIENKESRLEYQNQHYIKNRDTLLERRKKYRDNKKYICGCGSRVLNENAGIRTHEQTQRHKNYLLQM